MELKLGHLKPDGYSHPTKSNTVPRPGKVDQLNLISRFLARPDHRAKPSHRTMLPTESRFGNRPPPPSRGPWRSLIDPRDAKLPTPTDPKGSVTIHQPFGRAHSRRIHTDAQLQSSPGRGSGKAEIPPQAPASPSPIAAVVPHQTPGAQTLESNA